MNGPDHPRCCSSRPILLSAQDRGRRARANQLASSELLPCLYPGAKRSEGGQQRWYVPTFTSAMLTEWKTSALANSTQTALTRPGRVPVGLPRRTEPRIDYSGLGVVSVPSVGIKARTSHLGDCI